MPERPLALTCPDCGGALRKTGSGAAAQFRCHIGHIFWCRRIVADAIGAARKGARYGTARSERARRMARQMVEDARTAGREAGVRHWERVRAEAKQQADAIRQVLPGAAKAEDQPPELSE